MLSRLAIIFWSLLAFLFVGSVLSAKFLYGVRIPIPHFFAFIELMVRSYEDFALWIATPMVEFLVAIAARFDVSIPVGRDWPHAFSIMALKLIGDGIVDIFRFHLQPDIRKKRKCFGGFIVGELVLGFAISVVASLVAARQGLRDPGLGFALPVIIGVVVYEGARALAMFKWGYREHTPSEIFDRYILRAFGGTALAGILAVATSWLLSFRYDASTMSTYALATFVLGIMVLQYLSAWRTTTLKKSGWNGFFNDGQTQIGNRLLGSISVAMSVILASVFWYQSL